MGTIRTRGRCALASRSMALAARRRAGRCRADARGGRRPGPKAGKSRSVAGSQTSLGGVAIMRGDRARARRLFEESLDVYRGLDDVWGVSICLSNLALLALGAGETERSRTTALRGSRHRTRERPSRLARKRAPAVREARRQRLATRIAARYPAVRPCRTDRGDHYSLVALRARMARPHAEPRRPPLARRRGGVRGGVDARPRDDAPRGDRPGEPGAGRGRAGHAVAPVESRASPWLRNPRPFRSLSRKTATVCASWH